MAGRRLRKAVRDRLIAKGVMGQDATVVIAGLSDAYADYTTTFEEFQAQRYEAGSTIFGPHQLSGYIMEFTKLVDSMAAGTTPDSDPPAEDFSSKLIDLEDKGKLSTDYLPSGAKHFGDVTKQVGPAYKLGDVAEVSFCWCQPDKQLEAPGHLPGGAEAGGASLGDHGRRWRLGDPDINCEEQC